MTLELDISRSAFAGMRIAVTGVCGTVGSDLARQLLRDFEIGSLVGIDHNESELVFLQERLDALGDARLYLGDVRDPAMLRHRLRDVDVVFHCAACKHVYLCEHAPMEAVQTNVRGVQNVIDAARENNVGRMVFTSSDKAVNPTNVMGTSKLFGERLMTAASVFGDEAATVFVSTRFGNVLGSRGSVIPIFADQIKRGGPVTLTDPDMTRFIMSQSDAIRLVIESTWLGQPGDVLITKMKTLRIVDLAEVMIEELAPRYGLDPSDIAIDLIGPKPGEKLYEELMNDEETRRAIELDRYFVVRPALLPNGECQSNYPGTVAASIDTPYNSATQTPMTREELAAYLYEHDLLPIDDAPGASPVAPMAHGG